VNVAIVPYVDQCNRKDVPLTKLNIEAFVATVTMENKFLGKIDPAVDGNEAIFNVASLTRLCNLLLVTNSVDPNV